MQGEPLDERPGLPIRLPPHSTYSRVASGDVEMLFRALKSQRCLEQLPKRCLDPLDSLRNLAYSHYRQILGHRTMLIAWPI